MAEYHAFSFTAAFSALQRDLKRLTQAKVQTMEAYLTVTRELSPTMVHEASQFFNGSMTYGKCAHIQSRMRL
jgi:hypothetical protein